MRFTTRVLAAVAVALVAVAGVLGFYALSQSHSYPCGPQSMVQKTNLAPPVHFGAVTKYLLPQDRSPNAIAAAPDGSVWFAELGVPGVAHLYLNGSLVEYRWPYSYPQSVTSSSGVACSDWTNTWGIAIWDGGIWATNGASDSIVGLNPLTDSFQTIHVSTGSFPYTLTVGPDDRLWFTQLPFLPEVGSVDPSSHQVTYYPLPSGTNASAVSITFQNATLGYVLSEFTSSNGGEVFSFNPSASYISFTLVGGAEASHIAAPGNGGSVPTGIALGEGGMWVTEHSTSDMDFYNSNTTQWQTYPTSSAGYVAVTLPYFDVSNGTAVWFNEHFANRLAEICCNRTSLTEYSLSNPPASSISTIDNAETIALASDRVWFTEMTADYVGFVSDSYTPPFSVSLGDNSTIRMLPGSTAQIQLKLSGASPTPLSLAFSDSEQTNGAPKNITFAGPGGALSLNSSASGPAGASVTVSASPKTPPGQYEALITVTDGLVSRSVYLAIVVAT